MFARNALQAMFIALATLPAAGALVASADDGPSRRPDATGRPAITVLLPGLPDPSRAAEQAIPPATPSAGPRALVLLVGGMSSSHGDGSFDALAARLAGDPRYEVRRFGSDPHHRYDTNGALDPSADALIAEIRERAPHHSEIHLVTHSMGGVVVDRALDRGLSSRDGLRTVVSLASPRSGSTLARTAQGLLDVAGDEAPFIRSLLRPLGDVDRPAIRDLAHGRPATAPDGVTRMDLRLATDKLVLARDTLAPGTDSRTLLPRSASGLEGHGGILRDPRALDLVTATIALGHPPADLRSDAEKDRTSMVASLHDGIVSLGLVVLATALMALVVLLRLRRLTLRPLITPLVPRLWNWR